VAELHLHAGRAVLRAVVEALARCEGLRPAEPGEFTRRAFENGKLDLTAAEGLADLVNAETEAQRRQAFAQFRGALSGKAEAWRMRLIEALSLIEAAIDFSDEGDVPQNLLAPAQAIARELVDEIKPVIADARRGERLREGFTVAIAGPPNVGKSTLLNRLAEREVAIVSPIPGTTRDTIEVALDLKGVPVVLIDTAGMRETRDPIELEGVRRARARADAADLVLWLIEASERNPSPPSVAPKQTIAIRSKVDLVDSDMQQTLSGKGLIAVSGKTGVGIDRLIAYLTDVAANLAGEPALVTRERQRHALSETVARLESAIVVAMPGQEELFAEDLRLAARALGRITGRVGVEEVLDSVFKNFCIGK
jgi:tRNA modification GTPase